MNNLYQYLIIFGGQGNEGTYLNDVFIYNTVEDEWYFFHICRFEPMITGDIPRPRYYHAAATVIQNEQLIVFGGRTKNYHKI